MQRQFYTNNTDLAVSDEGDLIIYHKEDKDGKEHGQLTLVKGSEEVLQSVNIRLRTNLFEFFMHPDIGNQLLEIVGQRNTRETAERGRRYLISTILRHNKVIKEEHLVITVTPLDTNTLLYIIKIADGLFSSIDMMLELDLQQGIRRVV